MESNKKVESKELQLEQIKNYDFYRFFEEDESGEKTENMNHMIENITPLLTDQDKEIGDFLFIKGEIVWLIRKLIEEYNKQRDKILAKILQTSKLSLENFIKSQVMIDKEAGITDHGMDKIVIQLKDFAKEKGDREEIISELSKTDGNCATDQVKISVTDNLEKKIAVDQNLWTHENTSHQKSENSGKIHNNTIMDSIHAKKENVSSKQNKIDIKGKAVVKDNAVFKEYKSTSYRNNKNGGETYNNAITDSAHAKISEEKKGVTCLNKENNNNKAYITAALLPGQEKKDVLDYANIMLKKHQSIELIEWGLVNNNPAVIITCQEEKDRDKLVMEHNAEYNSWKIHILGENLKNNYNGKENGNRQSNPKNSAELEEQEKGKIIRKEFQLIGLPSWIKQYDVTRVLQQHGKVKSVRFRQLKRDQPNENLKRRWDTLKDAFITMELEEGKAKELERTWMIPIGRNCIRFAPVGINKHQMEERAKYTLGVKGFPSHLTAPKLMKAINNIEGKTCYIYRSTAYIAFETEEIMNGVLKKGILYDGKHLSLKIKGVAKKHEQKYEYEFNELARKEKEPEIDRKKMQEEMQENKMQEDKIQEEKTQKEKMQKEKIQEEKIKPNKENIKETLDTLIEEMLNLKNWMKNIEYDIGKINNGYRERKKGASRS